MSTHAQLDVANEVRPGQSRLRPLFLGHLQERQKKVGFTASRLDVFCVRDDADDLIIEIALRANSGWSEVCKCRVDLHHQAAFGLEPELLSLKVPQCLRAS